MPIEYPILHFSYNFDENLKEIIIDTAKRYKPGYLRTKIFDKYVDQLLVAIEENKDYIKRYFEIYLPSTTRVPKQTSLWICEEIISPYHKEEYYICVKLKASKVFDNEWVIEPEKASIINRHFLYELEKMYPKVVTFKSTPVELRNSLGKEIYEIEKKLMYMTARY